jgi:hypothetical protein
MLSPNLQTLLIKPNGQNTDSNESHHNKIGTSFKFATTAEIAHRSGIEILRPLEMRCRFVEPSHTNFPENCSCLFHCQFDKVLTGTALRICRNYLHR